MNERVSELPDVRLVLDASAQMPLHGMRSMAFQVFRPRHTGFDVGVATWQAVNKAVNGKLYQHAMAAHWRHGDDNNPFAVYVPRDQAKKPKGKVLLGESHEHVTQVLDHPPSLHDMGRSLGNPVPISGFVLPCDAATDGTTAYPLGDHACYTSQPGRTWLATYFVPTGTKLPSSHEMEQQRIRVFMTAESDGLIRCMVLPPLLLQRSAVVSKTHGPAFFKHPVAWAYMTKALIEADLGVVRVGLPIQITRSTAG